WRKRRAPSPFQSEPLAPEFGEQVPACQAKNAGDSQLKNGSPDFFGLSARRIQLSSLKLALTLPSPPGEGFSVAALG
ncbi:MAG: hypothetical protein AB1705_28335, partial [Verrucomicrobiota bacterium]